MVLNFIELKNFRLHINTNLEFSKNINYIVGGNGQGKTSLLEAIYYLCTTRNLNQNSDNDVLSFDKNIFEIKNFLKVIYNIRGKLSIDIDSFSIEEL